MDEQKPRILVVEDGEADRETLERILIFERFAVLTAASVEEALMMIEKPIDLVISDLRLGRQTGIDLLRTWHARRPLTPFIMITAFGEVDSAVTAMKLGAKDYLVKPFDPVRLMAQVRVALANAVDTHALEVTGVRLETIKKAAMVQALDRFSGNRTHAAQFLGISVRTLRRKLREWNLTDSPAV
jgi:DNA-binding NtrC family response regulator